MTLIDRPMHAMPCIDEARHGQRGHAAERMHVYKMDGKHSACMWRGGGNYDACGGELRKAKKAKQLSLANNVYSS